MLRPKSLPQTGLVFLCCALLAACGTAKGEPVSTSVPTLAPQIQSQHIVDLVDQHLITANITGISMDALALRIQSLSSRALQVEIPAGTFFVARNPQVQNMVARHPTSVLIQPLEKVELTVDAACASVRRAEPGSTDTFGIVRASEEPDLGKMIETLNKADVPYPVEQAAIWIVTDDASYDDLGMLVGGSPYGSALIGENQAVRAMQLVSDAGLDITRHAIWSEADTLRSKVTDADLTAWLDAQMAQAPTSTQSAAAPSTSGDDGEPISQWAIRAKADYESVPGSAGQAAGAPDTSGCGDQPTAWATGDTNTRATLTLWYTQSVIPSSIVIHQTYNPGAIISVKVRDQFVDKWYEVYDGKATLAPDCPLPLLIQVTDVPGVVSMVEISVDQSLAWTQIDAVELIGTRP